MRNVLDEKGDSPEMIQRCLSCELEVCLGLASCASGKAVRTKRCRDTYNARIVEMVLDGGKRNDICRELNLKSNNVAQYITNAVRKGLLTQEQADASRNYIRRKRGIPNGIHSKETPADR